MGWEMDPSLENLRIWAGTACCKMRPWWPTYTFENYIPACRAWTMMLNGGVWQAGFDGLVANQIMLGFQAPDPKAKLDPGQPRPALQPAPGDSLLLVCALRRDTAMSYRVLLIPFRMGGALPQVEYDAGTGVARLGQDEIAFTAGPDGHTRVGVKREGKEAAASR